MEASLDTNVIIHHTLMRIPDLDVMPFAFYEILFLDYLECRRPNNRGRIDEPL